MAAITPFTNAIRKGKIACIGAGYVGGPTMAVFASKCPFLEVHVADCNVQRIAEWNSSTLPIYEPDLQDLVQSCRGKNLFFSTDVKGVIQKCDIIFVSVNTPTKKIGHGAGCAADLSAWESVGRMIGEYADTHKIIIEKSTVPVHTADALAKVLQANDRAFNFVILSNPEFMSEGTAIRDLCSPDRVLIGGGRRCEEVEYSVNLLRELYLNWVPTHKILRTNLWSAELSKLVANAFLAQRISSINAVSQLCEATGADITEVANSIGADSRIGEHFLNASVGFGGSCFQKDLLNLVYIFRQFNLHEAAEYWSRVIAMNDHQKKRFAFRITEAMFNNVRNKKIAIFGFAFKRNTADTRETAALDVCTRLLDEGAKLHIYDPQVIRAQALREFADHELRYDFDQNFLFAESPLAAARGAHAIVVLTDWEEFESLDYMSFYDQMFKPSFIFDGRNILDHQKLFEIGFEIHAIGKVPASHKHSNLRKYRRTFSVNENPNLHDFNKYSAPIHSAPDNNCVPINSAPIHSAPINSAQNNNCVPINSAPTNSAPNKSAPINFAPIKSAPIKSAPIKSAPIKYAPIKSAPNNNCVPINSAANYTPIKGYNCKKTAGLANKQKLKKSIASLTTEALLIKDEKEPPECIRV